MKSSLIFSVAIVILGFSTSSFACPEPNSTMQVKKGVRKGKKFCAIRATDVSAPAQILKSTKFSADTFYILGSGLSVGDNEVRSNNENKIKLEIEAGTRIMGQNPRAYVQINRGAQIFAKGTPEKPIVFTTTKSKNRERGSWGGLVINGSAPVNGCDEGARLCELAGEGLTSYKYGGANPADSSGVLKYVVVEYAGFEITSENELNGIAFQGVGNGTVVDYVQVHMNADDGVEFFGGTVDVKHLVLTGNRDDSLDWTNGWKGSAQFVIIEQHGDAANYGIEADNFKKRQAATPRSAPVLANMTLIGSDRAQGAKGGSGILLRRGTGAYVLNSYITGFSNSCFDMDDNETFRNALSGNKENGNKPGVVFENVFFNCQKTFTPVENDEPYALESLITSQKGNLNKNLNLKGYSPASGSNQIEMTNYADVVNTNYVGAVKDETDTWYAGWISTSRN